MTVPADSTSAEVAAPAQDSGQAESPWFVRDGVPFPAGADQPADTAATPTAEELAEPAAQTDEPDNVARAFVALKRQKSKIAKAERELERRAQQVAADAAHYQRIKDLYAQDPYAAAQELGLNFRRIAEHVAKETEADPRDAELRATKAALEAVQAEVQAIKQERETLSARQADQEETTLLRERVAASAEEYPYLNAYGAERAAEAVRTAFYAHLERTGEQLDVAGLLDEYEESLRADYERLARINPPAAAAQAVAPARRNGAVQSAKTVARDAPAALSNRTAAQRASGDRPMTREERLQRAAAMLKSS